MSENKLQAGSRRYIASAVIGATLLAGVTTATLGVGSAEAQEVSKTLWKPKITSTYHYSTQQTVYTTASKTVRAYDIDGDKKKDVLTLRFTRTGRLVIGINGTRAKSIKASFDAPDPHIRVRYLKTKNNRPFLYVQYTGPNDDGVYAVYQGKKRNRLVKVAVNTDFPKKYATYHRYLGAVKTNGNKLLVTYEPMTYAAGTMKLTYSFAYNKKTGTMKRTSNTTSKVGLLTGTRGASIKRLHPYKRLTLYTSATAKKVRGYAPKGGKLAITKVCLKGGPKHKTVMMKVKTANGLTGWFKAPTTSYRPDPMVLTGGTLFEETYLAG